MPMILIGTPQWVWGINNHSYPYFFTP